MKKMALLFLASLLSCAVSPKGSAAIDFLVIGDLQAQPGHPTFARFRITDTEQPVEAREEDVPLTNLRPVELETRLIPNLHQLDPLTPIAQNLGTALYRLRIAFQYQGQEYSQILLDQRNQFDIRGEWSYREDPQNNQTLADLLLYFQDLHGRRIDVPHDIGAIPVNYIHVPQNPNPPQVEAGFSFDGRSVSRIVTQAQQWLNPLTNAVHNATTSQFLPDLIGHENHRVVFTQPFLGPDEEIPEEGFLGRYTFHIDLQVSEYYPHLNPKSLVYSDGAHIYPLHITQQKWRRGNITFVRFLVASFNPGHTLEFAQGARFVNHGNFNHEGLYQLLSVEERPENRLEKWALVQQNERPSPLSDPIYTLESPSSVPSIPGMGLEPLECPPLTFDEDVLTTIQRGFEGLPAHIQRQPGYINGYQRTVLMGPSGAGKSTLLHLLANQEGRRVIVTPNPDENVMTRLFQPEAAIDGLAVGHRAGVAGTTKPSAWVDEGDHVSYWDTNGLGDAGGPTQDIINAYALHEIFRNPSQVKIVLTVPEVFMKRENQSGRPFLQLLDQLIKSFPNGSNWHSSVCLVVSHSTDFRNPKQALRALLELPREENELLRVQRIRDFINYLSEGPDEQRVIAFRRPEFFQGLQIGNPYPEAERHRIIQCLTALHPLPDMDFKLHLTSDVRDFTTRLAQRMNDSIAHTIQTHVIPAIYKLCAQKIKNHGALVATLRADLIGLRHSIDQLSQIQEPAAYTFPDALNALFGINPGQVNSWMDISRIKTPLNNITFLKRLNEIVRYDIGSWTQVFTLLKNQLTHLTAAPVVAFDPQTHVLSLRGMLLGTSDVVAALTLHPTTKTINGFAFNTLLVEQDIIFPGGSVGLIAPYWRISGAHTFSLQGINGVNGAAGAVPGSSGAPGTHGEHGGHLYGGGQVFDHLHDLTVNVNGGSGGNGGAGSNGIDAISGEVGSEATLRSSQGLFAGFFGNIFSFGRRHRSPTFPVVRVSDFHDRHPVGIYQTRIPSMPLPFPQFPWTNRHSHEHCAFLRGTETTYQHGTTSGTPGTNGGDGGQPGQGGQSGSISLKNTPVLPATSHVVVVSNPGAAGTAGTGGVGGAVGTNGPVFQGTYITGANGHYNHEHRTGIGGFGSSTDRWECRQADHWVSITQTVPRTPLAGGAPGTVGANAAGQAPQNPALTAAQTTALQDQLYQDYRVAYLDQAANPLAAPFVQMMGGL